MRILAMTAAAILAAGQVHAATAILSDDSGISDWVSDYSYFVKIHEEGYVYTVTNLYNYHGFIIHDDHVSPVADLSKEDGGQFSLLNFDYSFWTRMWRSGEEDCPYDDSLDCEPWSMSEKVTDKATLWLTAWNGANKVGTLALKSTEIYGSQYVPVLLPNEFHNVSLVTFKLEFEDNIIPPCCGLDVTTANVLWCDEWCGETWLKDIVVTSDDPAPIPLPAGFPLLAAAIAAAAWCGRRQIWHSRTPRIQ